MSWFDITPDWAPTREPLAWMRRAACAGQSDYIFYTPSLYSEAKKLCAQCPVIRECLALADRAESTQKDVYGVFGGETPNQRILRRQWGPYNAAADAIHQAGGGAA